MPNVRDSGANLKLLLTGETYDGLTGGTIQTTGVKQIPLSPTPIPCWQVTLQASLTNQDIVYVGGGGASGCHVELNAGGSIDIPINDVNKVYIRDGGNGAQTVNWLALF